MAALLLSGSVAGAQDTAAPAPAPVVAPADAGRRVYTNYCARCHGLNLAVGSSAFFDLRTFPKDDKERFLNSVTNGKRAMPAWGGIVKPEEMDLIWAYIGQVNGW